jgi:predicted PurR-regulated permease PerM
VAVVIVLVLFLFSLQQAGVLNPFVLYLLLVAVLLPFRSYRHQAELLGLATLLTLFWAVEALGSLLAPFLVAAGLAYILDPAVDRLEKRGVGRTVGIAILAGPALVGLGVAAVLGAPALGDQLLSLIRQMPVLVERLGELAVRLEESLVRLPWIGQAVGQFVADLEAQDVTATLEARREEIAQQIWSGVLGVGRGLNSALTLLSYLVLAPVITFYLLRDWDGMVARVNDLVPRKQQSAVASFFQEFDGLLGRFLRGQITVALVMGALTGLGLGLWGFPYAVLIGVLVAVFSVVPYLGLVLSLLPAIIIALTSGNVGYALLKVAVVFGVVQGLEGAVISPRIVGESVGLHPVWILLAIATAGLLFGFVGLLLAVPMAVGVKLLLGRVRDAYLASPIYTGEPGAGTEA